ncbi:MAG: succinyldiaminopimelate transaminase [Actinobacteria bacterium]|nr:succinyldiaminopimelate transaminase [Actinomycetota bacterium]
MLASNLPDVPWDLLQPAADLAAAHPDGKIDLSIGTPVDSVAQVIQSAAAAALNAPGYPLTAGSKELVCAQETWLAKVAGADVSQLSTIPSVGSKEAVALLPFLLGLDASSTVAIPTLAYPSYAVGAQAVKAKVVLADLPNQLAEKVDLVWLNSPANPSGKVLTKSELTSWIEFSRDTNTLIASDECYLTLGWEVKPTSILTTELTNGRYQNLIALHSLSKRSSLAGYRAAAISGDKTIIAALLQARKHLGLLMPTPSQAAATAAWLDEGHALAQREVYLQRRQVMQNAFTSAGFRIEESGAGLYLWLTRDEDCWQSVNWLAERGVLVAPGSFYGTAGNSFIRAALTETDERIAKLANRLV